MIYALLMTIAHRTSRSIMQLERKGKYIYCSITVWRRLWDNTNQRRTCIVQYK